MPADPRRVKELFAAALDLPEPQARQALLDRECRDDPDLRKRLGMLLAAHEQPDSALNQPFAARPDATIDAPSEIAGTIIAGRYKLLEEIGEGGMGTVWMAEQREPVKRLVAVKLIKPGMDSRAVLTRFEAERQALALMDHPHIARVLDGGTTDQGRPYFVMELVKGVPLTEYCDDRHLSVRERLDLFAAVCAAVQHAHQKGVIHRDLKPANVLVTEHDGRPVPKVIDFGLAKALHATNMLTEKTLHTSFGAVVGTTLYMAPEQVGINALDVDTRTDIYALGVILYELLTGSTPLEKHRVKEAMWDEVQRLIREEEPPPPSTRLSTSDALPRIAARRHVEPAKLSRLVRGELDWIVMKALEKDRARRYETANGLARDVERYLRDEPVEACPPSAAYRVRKFLRRNRGPAVAAAAVLLAVVVGAGLATWQAIRATRAETEALAERDAKEAARQAEADQRAAAVTQKERAEKAEEQARQEAAISRVVRHFLQEDLLRQADFIARAEAARLSGGQFETKVNPTIKDLLDRAAAGLAPDKIEARFPGQPRLQAEILDTVGRTYGGVGNFENAIAHLSRAADLYLKTLGPTDLKTLGCQHELGLAYLFSRPPRLLEAIPLLEGVRDARVVRLGPDDEATLDTRIMLGLAYAFSGKAAAAVAELEPARAVSVRILGPDHIHVLAAEVCLTQAYYSAGRRDDAIAQARVAWGHAVRMLSPEHPYYVMVQNILAELYLKFDRPGDAAPLFEAVLHYVTSRSDADDTFTLHLLQQLNKAYQDIGQPDKSLLLLRRVVEVRRKKSPADPTTQQASQTLVQRLAELGRPAEAEAVSREQVAAVREKEGAGSPTYAVALMNLGRALMWQPGVPDGAEAVCREAVEVFRKADDTSSLDYSGALSNLGKLLLQQGNYAEAEPILRECQTIRGKVLPGSWGLANTTSMLGGSLLGQGRYDEAEPLLRTAYRDMTGHKTGFNPILDRVRFAEATDRLAELCEKTGRADEAAKWRTERAKWAPRPSTEVK